VRIRATRERLANGEMAQLKDLLRRYPGASITYLHLGFDDGREAVFLLGDGYRVAPTEGFVAEVEQLLSANAVQLR
jgi:hypothetical protein